MMFARVCWTFEVPRSAMSKGAAWRRCVRSGRRIGIPTHAWLKDHDRGCTCDRETGKRDPYCPIGDQIGYHPIGVGGVWRWHTDTNERIAARGRAVERRRAAKLGLPGAYVGVRIALDEAGR